MTTDGLLPKMYLRTPVSHLHQHFLFKFFNWRVIAKQYCVGFCHITPGISHRYTYVTSLLNLSTPPTPSHPSRLSKNTGVSSLYLTAASHWLCFTHGCVYMSMLLSQFVPPSPSLTASRVCSLCLHLYSCPTNRFISTIFLYFIYIH